MMPKMKGLLGGAVVLLFSVAVSAFQPSGGQGSFTAVPIDQLPPTEQLPAAQLLIAAYAFAWIAVFLYVWTVWRRLNKVETEMRVLEQRQSHRGEGPPGVDRGEGVPGAKRTSPR